MTRFIVDDHAVVRRGARAFLDAEEDFVVVGDVGSGGEAIRKAARGEAVIHSYIATRLVQELEEEKGHSHRNGTLYALLSEREREVLRLIAEGCSNGEIARRLVISEKTVKSQVGNILSKLHLEDRTQVAVFAWREGLMKTADNPSRDHSTKYS